MQYVNLEVGNNVFFPDDLGHPTDTDFAKITNNILIFVLG